MNWTYVCAGLAFIAAVCLGYRAWAMRHTNKYIDTDVHQAIGLIALFMLIIALITIGITLCDYYTCINQHFTLMEIAETYSLTDNFFFDSKVLFSNRKMAKLLIYKETYQNWSLVPNTIYQCIEISPIS